MINWEKEGRLPIKLWVGDITEVESEALDQLKNIAGLPIIHNHVAVMPDVHAGKGSTIGTVIPTVRAIIPAAVGVDLGCGMAAYRTNLTAEDLPDSLAGLRSRIEAMMPVGQGGFCYHEDPYKFQDGRDQVVWTKLWAEAESLAIWNKTKGSMIRTFAQQLGSMGGGNHFFELCLDEQDRVWVMLHSGSRRVGKEIADFHIGIAKNFAATEGIHLPDKDLAWLSADKHPAEFAAYVRDIDWAQRYAMLNRKAMLEIATQAIFGYFDELDVPVHYDSEVVNCHHNYVQFGFEGNPDVYITRKGAVSAYEGEFGIIPGSMGTRSYIVRGLGNTDAFCSCSHGAGRRMSRTKAKQNFTVDDLVAQTAGVECKKDASVLDEIPACYKDIDQVMANQQDLVEAVHTLKQVMCIKG